MIDDKFLVSLANSSIGADLIKYLKEVEIENADIRNLRGVPAEVRIDALKIWRESLLDKLLILTGELEPADNDEYR